MQFPRSSGILQHITSLPSPYGIGDLGPDAYRFVDFLAESGQSIWQILPVSPTIRCDSPYSAYSALAGNPLMVSPQLLLEAGLVDLPHVRRFENNEARGAAVDYNYVTDFKWQLLSAAFDEFIKRGGCPAFDEFESFCVNQRWWLDDFALFAACMKSFQSDEWSTWEADLVARESLAMGRWKDRLSREVEFEQFVQYVFFSQWAALKSYANASGVKLFGDMPIFVANGSADVWANQSLFHLDERGKPTVVAGVPPDYFSKTGQLWGNPLYDWEAIAENKYRWWTGRFRSAFELYDLLRIDHFRGFEAYWEVTADAKTAVDGRWAPGPGAAPFDAARAELGELAIVAEDLGLITDAVHELRQQLGFPGMRVFQFGFDDENDGFHRPDQYPGNSIAYTGTHDNSTLMGWFDGRVERLQSGDDVLLRHLRQPIGERRDVQWEMIELVMKSASHTAVVPLQDVLGLDDSARMNIPGQAVGNWQWRVQPDLLNRELISRLRESTEASDRLAMSTVG